MTAGDVCMFLVMITFTFITSEVGGWGCRPPLPGDAHVYG